MEPLVSACASIWSTLDAPAAEELRLAGAAPRPLDPLYLARCAPERSNWRTAALSRGWAVEALGDPREVQVLRSGDEVTQLAHIR
jgi:hypothetical protein